MKRTAAFLLALLMLLSLTACKKDEPETDENHGGLTLGQGPSDTADGVKDPADEEDEVGAIGVANPYVEIGADELADNFGLGLNVPQTASQVHYFNIDTGGGTKMLQVQFVSGGIQYILRAKSAGKLADISAAYAIWDSEEACSVSGSEGTLKLSNGGAGSLIWYDDTTAMSYALSASGGATAMALTQLAAELYVPGAQFGAVDVSVSSGSGGTGGGGNSGSTGSGSNSNSGGSNVPSLDPVPAPPAADPIEVRVYYPASDGVSFTSVTLTTEGLSAEELADYLVNRLIGLGVLNSGVKVQSIEGMSLDETGGSELALSLSSAFGTQINNAGVQGEYMLVGSVVNTFLESYDADRIWLYADNKEISGAAGSYDGPLTRYGTFDVSKIQPSEETPDTPAAPDADATLAEKVCALAKSKTGAEYEYGASGPDTFDNSGFVYYCFAENGVTVPRRTSDMFSGGTAVDANELQAGDMVFFAGEEDRNPSYVGIYLGNGQFIAESREGNPVKVMDMTTAYWQGLYLGARRYL